MTNFSVLISIYKNEKAEYLKEAIESIYKQTVLFNELVIVKDGPLTSELEKILNELADKHDNVKFVELKENKGLGLALREGVNACSNEWIARMDTDDVAKINRFEKQIKYLEKNPDISLLGTCVEEFSNDIKNPETKTILPIAHDEIIKFAKKRNPFRHMTVMFKKSAVLESGNYRDFLWFEDYDLWVRIINKGFKVANLPDILVSVRADKNMFARRGGWKYLKQDIKFQKELFDFKLINYKEFILNILIRGIVRILPNNIRVKIYEIGLRNKIK